MSEPFAWEPDALAATLRQRGYDVDAAGARLGGGSGSGSGGGSIAARRERSDRAVLVVVDAGGRFKAEITAVVADRARRVDAAGLELRVVETEQTVTTVTATLPDSAAVAPLLDEIDRRVGSPGGILGRWQEPRS